MSLFISSLFDGVSIGAVLLMSALGLAIVFGLMGVINLAHGEMMMLGAYTTYVVQNVAKGWGEPWTTLYVFPALFLAFGVAALAGLILERGVIRFLYGRPLETLLATWGISLILRESVRSATWGMAAGIGIFSTIFLGTQWFLGRTRAVGTKISNRLRALLFGIAGGVSIAISQILLSQGTRSFWGKSWFGKRNIDVTPPAWLRGSLKLGDLNFPYARLFIIILMIVCVIGTYWFLQKSRWGLRIRAVTQNREMSSCLGIPTNTVDALTFALGSGLAGIAGCAVTFLGSVGPNLGSNYIVDAFMVVVVGGVGKLVGTIVASMIIGVTSYLIGSGTIPFVLSSWNAELFKPVIDVMNFFATSSMAKVLIFALIILFLQVRPAGLFPQKGRSVDA
ncbi:branched-chain amino acid ABC transporter permease [filamentous cyanobacterium LEGE 11480]|uniref:Branched-chain amino acid ABC transporter permease n=1 Tax=Romeriopsis navalis LEGE 11480 TaxID=2777977 RepID=A0A928VSF4_9CYAN|nr:branched-chain amino acid ABC transporter permease [Romeriopsis navalis]MBE9032907.1 branched-chain amino acid ABC transporter permease [Romeriopsis navalis LEGE 11480]